jgi:hypothetical protein
MWQLITIWQYIVRNMKVLLTYKNLWRKEKVKSKAVPLHAMEALGGGEEA